MRKTITKKALVKNERKNAKKKQIEKTITNYISSRQINIKKFSITTRQHWSVENKVH